MASILEDFSFENWRHEFPLVRIPGDNPLGVRPRPPEFLLYEAGWRANKDQWRNQVIKPGPALKSLITRCRSQRVPTVFWNIEDPPNYEEFLPAARLADWVFTTDADLVPRYKRDLGHSRVRPLLFAAQPLIHNPMGTWDRRSRVCFAGTWYPWWEHRKKHTTDQLRAAAPFGLDIYDRMHGHEDPQFRFPEEFQRYVRGSLAYQDMASAYRRYKAFLNVNIVEHSSTMMAMRVFELLGSGTPVVSSPSPAIDNVFGDLVLTASSEAGVRACLDQLFSDEQARKARAHRGYRLVHRKHTYRDRGDTIRRHLGRGSKHSWPLVTVVIPTNRPGQLEHALQNYQQQTYPNTELVVVLNSSEFDVQAVHRRVKGLKAKVLSVPPERSLGFCLNLSVGEMSGDFWSKFDDDNLYGPEFLWDLMLPFYYSGADIVGKNEFFYYLERSNLLVTHAAGRAHTHTDFVAGSALVVKKSVFRRVRFPDQSVGEDSDFLEQCKAAGIRMYSADPYNFVCMRRNDPSSHTWQVEDEAILRYGTVLSSGLDEKAVML